MFYEWAEDSRLEDVDVHIMAQITLARRKGDPQPSMETLARQWGCSTPQIRLRIYHLSNLGYLTLKRSGKRLLGQPIHVV
jgi:hypothetical protein